MPQLHFSISSQLAQILEEKARTAGVSLSSYLANLVQTQISNNWPVGYFEQVVGRWSGRPLERMPQGNFEERELF
ncbi:MAG: hypothetical protein JW841_06045 [Deltaproteobacteria bacterium]|nr:hypothetical protein [Deltaproteobacteria bacterium]